MVGWLFNPLICKRKWKSGLVWISSNCPWGITVLGIFENGPWETKLSIPKEKYKVLVCCLDKSVTECVTLVVYKLCSFFVQIMWFCPNRQGPLCVWQWKGVGPEIKGEATYWDCVKSPLHPWGRWGDLRLEPRMKNKWKGPMQGAS